MELDLKVTPGSDDQAICHLMPCSIEHKQTNVRAREYFWPTVRQLEVGGDDDQGRTTKHSKSIGDDNIEDPILVASFRGRPLQGRLVKIPDGYRGHMLSKQDKSHANNNKANNGLKVKKHFDEFTYWNWDQLPSKNDAVVKAMGWLRISKSIHDPV